MIKFLMLFLVATAILSSCATSESPASYRVIKDEEVSEAPLLPIPEATVTVIPAAPDSSAVPPIDTQTSTASTSSQIE